MHLLLVASFPACQVLGAEMSLEPRKTTGFPRGVAGRRQNEINQGILSTIFNLITTILGTSASLVATSALLVVRSY